MTAFFKAGDEVRVLPNPYNITDRRVGYVGIVTRVDAQSQCLPVRIEYQTGDYNWTNYESLELVKAAPSRHAEVGAEILDKMVELKASIVARDNAIKLVVDQTEALDALLAQYGLKRGEEVPAAPEVKAPRNAKEAYDAGTIKVGDKFRLMSDDLIYFTVGRVYTVSDLDKGDACPVAFTDNDDDEEWMDYEDELEHFVVI